MDYGLNSGKLELTLRQKERLERLWRRYARQDLDGDLSGIIVEMFELDISGRFGPHQLINPFIVAAGPATSSVDQVLKAADSGWGAVVLNPVAGEDSDGGCSMSYLRSSTSAWMRNTYDPSDTRKMRPVVLGNMMLDERPLNEYVPFAESAVEALNDTDTKIIGSFLAHLPGPGEELLVEEWSHTASSLKKAGIDVCEIAFLPAVIEDKNLEVDSGFRRRNVSDKSLTEWYSGSIKEAREHIRVWPRILQGEDWQEWAELSFNAGADGIVISSKFPHSGSPAGIGGEQLRQINLQRMRELGQKRNISASGGVYSGLQALEYICLGATSVQVFSYVIGKVSKPVKRSFNKQEQVLYDLILNPKEGLVAGMLHLKNTQGLASILEVADSAEVSARGQIS